MSIFDENREECPRCNGRIETWKEHVCRTVVNTTKYAPFPFDRSGEKLMEKCRTEIPVQKKKTPDPSYLLDPDHMLFDI